MDRLTALLGAHRPGLRIARLVRAGDPADETLAAAAERGADLVAAGTYGLNAVERLLVGSVSTAIVRRAGTAVLACREPDAREVARIERALFGVTEQADQAACAALLADATARNAGRRDALVQERGYAFLGAAYDRHDRRVELMFGDPDEPTRHVTHSVGREGAVQVTTGADGRDAALRVEHREGTRS
jgi:hypothetical protein